MSWLKATTQSVIQRICHQKQTEFHCAGDWSTLQIQFSEMTWKITWTEAVSLHQQERSFSHSQDHRIMVPISLLVTKFLLPVSMNLSPTGLAVLVPDRGVLLPRDTNIPLNWKLKLAPGHFGFLVSLSHQVKKGIKVLGGLIDPDYQRKSVLLLSRGSFRMESRGSFRAILVLLYPVIKVNGKLQFNAGKVTEVTDSQEWRCG